MEAENVLNLLDSYWYDVDLFKRSKPIKSKTNPEMPTSSLGHIPTLPSIHTKSSPNFDNLSSSSNRVSSISSKLSDSSVSPNSVLSAPKLQTIFSGKIAKEFEQETTPTVKNTSSSSSPMKDYTVNSRRRKKRGLSKSLSNLEFEELKGFMDLGFVFSEEDKDSTLANIIPGLQRLGTNNTADNNSNNNNNNNNTKNVTVDEKIASKGAVNKFAGTEVSRPYLSEAWEVLEKKKKESSLLNWKVPATTSQMDMKGYLKFWAHSVASTVK